MISAKESSWFNMVTTIIHIGFIAFIIIAGFAKGNASNITAGVREGEGEWERGESEWRAMMGEMNLNV